MTIRGFNRINSLLRKVVSSNEGTTRAFGLTSDIKRYFTNFISSRSSYAVLNTSISLNTSYKIRADVQFDSSVVVDAPIIGKSAGFSHVFEITSSGELRLIAQFDSAVTTGTISRDDEVHEVEVELSGNDFIFRVDGNHFETVTSLAAAEETFTFNAIGTRDSSEFFDGYIANVHVEENSIAMAYFSMDESFSEPNFENSVDPSNPAVKSNILVDQVIEVIL